MPARAAVELLERHRSLIAHAIARQIMQTLPQYRSVDPNDLAGSIDELLEGVQTLLIARDHKTLAQVLDTLVQLHNKRGFGVGDFLVATLCTLPVMRRFYMKYASAQDQGIVCYEQVESVLIPLYGHLAARLSNVFDDDDPTLVDDHTPGQQREEAEAVPGVAEGTAQLEPFEIVSVDEVLQLKAEHRRVSKERDHLARELEDMKQAVESALKKEKQRKKKKARAASKTRRPVRDAD